MADSTLCILKAKLLAEPMATYRCRSSAKQSCGRVDADSAKATAAHHKPPAFHLIEVHNRHFQLLKAIWQDIAAILG